MHPRPGQVNVNGKFEIEVMSGNQVSPKFWKVVASCTGWENATLVQEALLSAGKQVQIVEILKTRRKVCLCGT